MAYKLEHVPVDHMVVLVETLQKWSNSQPDVYIISEEGHKVYTHKLLVGFYSSTLSSVLRSSMGGSDIPGISVPAPSTSIVNLLKVLATGIAIANNKADLVAVSKTAEALGIIMENWQIGVKNKGVNLSKKAPEPPGKDELIETSQDKKHECADCGKTFGSKYHLNRHATTHSGASYPCDSCGSIFKRKEGLRVHMSKVHDGSLIEEEASITVKVENDEGVNDSRRAFERESLEEANEEYSSYKDSVNYDAEGSLLEESEMELGDNLDSDGNSKYGCNLCEKRFKNSTHLKRHEVVHSGIKFSCTECPSTFSRKDKLTSHIRKKHSSLTDKEEVPVSEEMMVTAEVDHFTDKVEGNEAANYLAEGVETDAVTGQKV